MAMGELFAFLSENRQPTSLRPRVRSLEIRFQLLDRQPNALQDRPQRSRPDVVALVNRNHADSRRIFAVGNGHVASLAMNFVETSSGQCAKKAIAVDLRQPAHAASTRTASIEVRGSGISCPNFTSASR